MPFRQALRDSGPGSTLALAALGLLFLADAAVGASAVWVVRLSELSFGSIDPGAAWQLRPIAFVAAGVVTVWFFRHKQSRKLWAGLAALLQAVAMVVAAFAPTGLTLLICEIAAAVFSGVIIASALPMLWDVGRPEMRVRLAEGLPPPSWRESA